MLSSLISNDFSYDGDFEKDINNNHWSSLTLEENEEANMESEIINEVEEEIEADQWKIRSQSKCSVVVFFFYLSATMINFFFFGCLDSIDLHDQDDMDKGQRQAKGWIKDMIDQMMDNCITSGNEVVNIEESQENVKENEEFSDFDGTVFDDVDESKIMSQITGKKKNFFNC